jgi:hypothetical protein
MNYIRRYRLGEIWDFHDCEVKVEVFCVMTPCNFELGYYRDTHNKVKKINLHIFLLYKEYVWILV